MKTKIMYMEFKSRGDGGGVPHDDRGEARIGCVTFSKSSHSLHYKGKTFQRVPGGAGCGNYRDSETGDIYWISGAKKDGTDRYYWGKAAPVWIDDDIREEYWVSIREKPERVNETKQ
jgi:hypothetical protein